MSGSQFNQSTSPNRAYLASCLQYFAKIQPYGWTSDTLGTLYAIEVVNSRESNLMFKRRRETC